MLLRKKGASESGASIIEFAIILGVFAVTIPTFIGLVSLFKGDDLEILMERAFQAIQKSPFFVSTLDVTLMPVDRDTTCVRSELTGAAGAMQMSTGESGFCAHLLVRYYDEATATEVTDVIESRDEGDNPCGAPPADLLIEFENSVMDGLPDGDTYCTAVHWTTDPNLHALGQCRSGTQFGSGAGLQSGC